MSQDVHKSDVLTPSVASVAFCSFGLLLSLFFIVLPRLGGDAILGLIFGRDASATLINSSKESYGPLFERLLSNDLFGRAVVFGVWAFVGLCAFVLVSFVIGVFNNVEEEREELGYVHQNRSALIKENISILGFRLGMALVWAGFLVLWIRYVLSYFTVTGFVAFGAGSLADWGVFLLACMVLFLALHIQVVLARLIAGRTRIWQD